MLPLPLVIYCMLILLASLAGGWIPIIVRLTHTRMQLAISFVAGVMLGVGLLHLLPHAVLALDGEISITALWMLLGFVLLFFLQRFFHVHHHPAPHDGNGPGQTETLAHEHRDDHHREYDDLHGHGHLPVQRFSWTGAGVGLTLHSTVDGIALAAGVEAALHDAHAVGPVGLATFLAIILHKPFDSLTIGTLMAAGGWSHRMCHLVNAVYALMIPFGAVLFYLGISASQGDASWLLGRALGFAAGVFLCIATSDLLPEVQFHAHDRIKLSIALLLGIALAWGVEMLGHSHQENGLHENHVGDKPRTGTPSLGRRPLLHFETALGTNPPHLGKDVFDHLMVGADVTHLNKERPADQRRARKSDHKVRRDPRCGTAATGARIGGLAHCRDGQDDDHGAQGPREISPF